MTPEAPRANPFSIKLTPVSPAELSGGNNLLQSGFWGSFKAASGWIPKAFLWTARGLAFDTSHGVADTRNSATDTIDPSTGPLGNPEAAEGRLLILERTFPGGLAMAYVPYGPELPEGISPDVTGPFLSSLASAVKPHLKRRCFLLRFDLTAGTRGPVSAASTIPQPRPLPLPLRRAPYRVQPPDTVILNLSPDEETLLAGMHKKTRYNIRLAARKGVKVTRLKGQAALDALPIWYRLYEETGKRDGIALHSQSYYRRLFSGEIVGNGASRESADCHIESCKDVVGKAEPGASSCKSSESPEKAVNFPGAISSESEFAASLVSSQSPSFSLYLAEHEGQELAGIIVSRIGLRATYMYGASGGRKRELMPNYLLQWQALTDARAEGAEEYDFFGIPPSDNPDHPMHGLWRMKTGFGGEILHYLGAWDYPMIKAVYSFYALAERLRGKWAAFRKRRR